MSLVPGRVRVRILTGLVVLVAAGCDGSSAPPGPPATNAPAAAARAPQTPSIGANPAGASARVAALRPAFADIDRMFREFAERTHAPGIAYGVVVDGALAHSGSWGVRDAASRAPIDQDTVFRIASMSKSFAAAAILKLRDEGRLSLDDLAERYVPELASLKYPTADSPKITVRHLLSHSAGFPEDNPWGDRQLAVTDEKMRQMLERGIPFSNPPGLAYEYSNYGFAILGRIVSNVTKQRYADYMKASFFAPLGLSSTTMEAADVPADRLAHGYRWEDERWKDEPPLPDGAFGPMGGMLTSSRDLARWVALMVGAWPPRDDPDTNAIRRASLREMQQVSRMSRATARPNAAGATVLNAGGYGFGLRVSQTCDFGHVVAHTGGLPGYGSVMTWLPDYGIGVFAMSNLTYNSGSAIASEALGVLVRTGGLRPRAATPSQALLDARDAVTSLINDWDDAVADRIAAENLYLDVDKARRRAAIEALRAKVGVCRADQPFEVENALRGQWTLSCERGALRVAITLAPSMPPLVQHLAVGEGAPPAQPPCGGAR
jgi:CubicO group peptidase (beta-lactamase class C family)